MIHYLRDLAKYNMGSSRPLSILKRSSQMKKGWRPLIYTVLIYKYILFLLIYLVLTVVVVNFSVFRGKCVLVNNECLQSPYLNDKWACFTSVHPYITVNVVLIYILSTSMTSCSDPQ